MHFRSWPSILIPFLLKEICSGQTFIAYIKNESNSVNTVDRIMVLALCSSSESPDINVSSFIKFPYLLSEIYFEQAFYCKKKNKNGNNFVKTVDRVMILAFCISADGCLSMHQVSFSSLVYFQRYSLDKFFIAKIKNESNSVKSVDRVTILALCSSADGRLSMCQV